MHQSSSAFSPDYFKRIISILLCFALVPPLVYVYYSFALHKPFVTFQNGNLVAPNIHQSPRNDSHKLPPQVSSVKSTERPSPTHTHPPISQDGNPTKNIELSRQFGPNSIFQRNNIDFKTVHNNLYTKAFRSPLYDRTFPNIPADVEKQAAVKEAFSFAWHVYERRCWGEDELRPQSGSCKNWLHAGLTIVDSMTTLLIMDLEPEYIKSRKYIVEDFKMDGEWSLFEIIIRWIGSFVSLFDMTGDELYRARAIYIAKAVLPFIEANGYYKAPVTIRSDVRHNIRIHPRSGTYLISEIGTYQLEFCGLSRITGDPTYLEIALKAYRTFWRMHPNQAIPGGWEANKGGSGKRYFGPMTDSYYEYVIKTYVMLGGVNKALLDRHIMMMKEIRNEFLFKAPLHNLTVVGQVLSGRLVPQQEHLGTFLAGAIEVGTVRGNPTAQDDGRIAGELVDQYAYVYRTHKQKVMSETINFDNSANAKKDYTVELGDYMLRPETAESIYVLWKFTGEQKYRDYAWELFLALNTTCRLPGGFTAIGGTNSDHKRILDDMPSFLFAETFKYLYLTFSDSAMLSPIEWVLNTEAHPIRIFNDEEAEKWKSSVNSILRPRVG